MHYGGKQEVCPLYMSRSANNALLGGGVRVRFGVEKKKEQKEILGIIKLLMVILDISPDHNYFVKTFCK